MELKKNPKQDLQNKRGLFLEIGLVVSFGLMMLLFGFSQKEKNIELLESEVAPVEEEIVEITRQDKKPPEPIRQTVTVVSDIINIVKNDTKIETNIKFDDFSEEAVVVAKVERREESSASDEPFMVVELMPQFQNFSPGDQSTAGFQRWVQTTIIYPDAAIQAGISGRVFVEFVVKKDGSVGDIKVLMSPDASLAEATVEALKKSPKWKPGRQRAMPVNVIFRIPVEFTLQ